jgi:hypothetical protein
VNTNSSDPPDRRFTSRFRGLSWDIANLVLKSAGESKASENNETRRAWHLFLYSTVIAFVWYLFARLILSPSLSEIEWFHDTLRSFELGVYSYLFIVLTWLGIRHYRSMILPGTSLRAVTVLFFFLASLLIFSRVYYSLYSLDPTLFTSAHYASLPTSEFGLNGTKDLGASFEFAVLSGCSLLNCSYSSIESNSLLISSIRLLQTTLGYLFLVVLLATFIQNKIALLQLLEGRQIAIRGI